MTVTDVPILTDAQRQFFDTNGFLVVEDALPTDMVERLIEACDRADARMRKEQNLGPHDRSQKRNVLMEDPDAFLPLVDWHRSVPLAWQILGWNVHLITSHLIILPPAAPGAERKKRMRAQTRKKFSFFVDKIRVFVYNLRSHVTPVREADVSGWRRDAGLRSSHEEGTVGTDSKTGCDVGCS